MFLIELTYPSEEEEIQIARSTTGDDLVAGRFDVRLRRSWATSN